MKRVPKITTDELLAAQDAAIVDARAALEHLKQQIGESASDEVPAGWRTKEQWTKEWGISENSVRVKLACGVKIVVVETAKFRVRCGDFIRPVPHYRVIAKKH